MHLRWPFAALTGALLALACSSGSTAYCPGLCPIESIFPTMTIEVAGGAASIASAEVTSGPCAHLLIHSAGEDGAPSGYAAAQITYNGPFDIPPLCVIKLTSLDGATVVVATSVTATSSQSPCCPYGSCCQESSAISLHHHIVFDQPVQTISFPGMIDGGVDGGADAAAQDVPQAAESGGVDSAEAIDAGQFDAADESALDGETAIDASLDF
jgi:hypothetical protein